MKPKSLTICKKWFPNTKICFFLPGPTTIGMLFLPFIAAREAPKPWIGRQCFSECTAGLLSAEAGGWKWLRKSLAKRPASKPWFLIFTEKKYTAISKPKPALIDWSDNHHLMRML